MMRTGAQPTGGAWCGPVAAGCACPGASRGIGYVRACMVDAPPLMYPESALAALICWPASMGVTCMAAAAVTEAHSQRSPGIIYSVRR